MSSRATRKPSLLCWLLASLLGLVAVSLFTGTALWLGAADNSAVFAGETVVPGIVRVDETVRPAGDWLTPANAGGKSVNRRTNVGTTTPSSRSQTTEPSTTRPPPPDVTSLPADVPTESVYPGVQDDSLRQTQGAMHIDLLPYNLSPLPTSDDTEVQSHGYRIPSEELISLTKRGDDFRGPQSESKEQHSESFTNMNLRPMKFPEFDYDSGFKGMEVSGGAEVYDNPVRRFDKNVPPAPSGEPGTYDGEPADVAQHPVLGFLQRKLQELHDWLSSDEDMTGAHNGTRLVAEFKDVLVALNESIAAGDVGLMLGKLRQLYRGSSHRVGLADPAVVGNTSSLVSFGLLAFDLLLLHNVQHIAWEEERLREAEMLRDPEVLALNALFMPADKVRSLLQPRQRSGDDEPEKERTIGEELVEFMSGAFRGVLNLGRAFRHSAQTAARSQSSGTPLDCIWTLYCRNLDKTSRLRGPYGFLAKMNSFGLRLVMGEFPMDNILESVVREFTRGWSRIDCQKLFPRCSVKEATSVVLKSVLREEVKTTV